MMGDPYQEDFYNQVFQTLVRNRVGPGDNSHSKSGTRTGKRQNALQRMEAQVERIINNVRLREKEKDLHCRQSSLD
jgi:DNA topoisomerase 2-associated protein PAT1